MSHFVLDLPIHPKDLALYPHSSMHLGWNLWAIGPRKYWYVQLFVVLPLTLIYAQGARKLRFAGNLVLATCIFLLGLHLLMFPSV